MIKLIVAVRDQREDQEKIILTRGPEGKIYYIYISACFSFKRKTRLT